MHAKDLVPALMQRGINLSDTVAWRFKAREWVKSAAAAG